VKIDPASYDAWYGTAFGSLCHRLEKGALFSLVSFNPGDKVLDAGCGTGVYLEELLRLGLDVTGVDQDEDMLEYASNSNRGGGSTLIKAALQDLPFEPSIFDKVISVCTLEFMDDSPRVLTELSRVLKKDGILLLGFLNKNSPWARRRRKYENDPASIWYGVRFFSLADIAGLASNASLRMKGFKGAVYFPPEAEGKDIHILEAMEADGMKHSPSEAAFIAAAFLNIK
jgi:SAM-dependent methyltransferase